MQDKLYEMLIQKDEISWQSIIYDLVNSEQMDPWDIDVSILAKRYLETIKTLQKHNFFISGKVLLASAILLKIKSTKLLTENIADFDNQLFQREEDLLEEMDDFQQLPNQEAPPLLIKTPHARKRKINLNDLMNALQKALEVNNRRTVRRLQDQVVQQPQIPEKKVDISILIKQIYEKIKQFFVKKERLTFDKLVPSDRKEDKILTLLPLLHLDNQGKVNLNQEIPFGEILITEGGTQND